MSTIGKVLVFFVLILSVAFLASSIFVLNQSETYKGKYESEKLSHENDKKTDTDTISKRETELKQKSDAVANRDNQIATLQAEKDSLSGHLKDADNFKNSVSENMNKLMTEVDNYGKRNEELQKTVEASRAEANKNRDERDAAKKAQDDAENKLAQAEESGKQLTAEVNMLKTKTSGLSEENASKQLALETYAKRTGIPLGEVYKAPPTIDGLVVTVAGEQKLVQLNVGSDSQVKPGYGFTIYRGSEFKGEVIVEDVQPKFATARIRYAVKPITVGDQAKSGIF
ncbi:MAG: hypothetical protein HY286_15825 [Planctomycetes bacterium]|nr:hypothetical protein [Planctomycetota bacterium]